MKTRCLNPNRENYQRYGGRGITVCKRWMDDFTAFFKDVGPRPSPSHTLDRENNDGNYEPGNVRWVTIRIQNSNTRRTIDADGMCAAHFAERVGKSAPTIRRRSKLGIEQSKLGSHEAIYVNRYFVDGAKLKAIRLSQFETARIVAERCGIAPAVLCHIERNRLSQQRGSSESTVRKLADGLNCQISDFAKRVHCVLG